MAADKALQLLELGERALGAQTLKDLAERVLSSLATIMQSSAALLYVGDAQLAAPLFFQHGLEPEPASQVCLLCAQQFDQLSDQPSSRVFTVPVLLQSGMDTNLALYPLHAQAKCMALIGLTVAVGTELLPPGVLDRTLGLVANAIHRLVERAELQRQLAHLNAYLNVSSLLVQSLDLHELLEFALYSSMEAVSAEAASVLLLDDEKKSFLFYQVEGPAKPVLMAATFSADQGLAGAVLRTLQSEVINNVQGDPRFYRRVDAESGFETRNMIAVPLVAGDERVGVLEVLNKSNGGSFNEGERLLLVSIAEEIAFAIRNAKLFEYVASTYCKQRQGLRSCKGCERPLGSWTPCVKYREAAI
jgi:hypothetical protein